jgi:hypothetical protein
MEVLRRTTLKANMRAGVWREWAKKKPGPREKGRAVVDAKESFREP